MLGLWFCFFFSPCALLVLCRAVVPDLLPFMLLFFSMSAFFLSLYIEICSFFSGN